MSSPLPSVGVPERRLAAWGASRIAIGLALAGLGVFAVGMRPALIPLFWLAAVTPDLVRIDIREHRLPNRLVLPGVLVGLAAAVGESVVTGEITVVPLVAATALAAFLLLLTIGGGMGLGDVKLGAVLGLASWSAGVAVLSPVLAFLAGGVASVILISRHGRGGRLAFGPYLLAGFWAAVALSCLT